MKRINIAIDGPSAAGKSTIADIVSQKLGYTHLDTGAMYRAVAYKAIKENIQLDDEEMIVKMIEGMDLLMPADGKVILDQEDVSEKIRANEISMGASDVSKLKGCRQALVAMQQKICQSGGYVLDGRDIGTVVLPDAPVKIFMVASAQARASRRVKQNIEKGLPADYDEILEDIIKRDYQDTHRDNSPLVKAVDAVEIDTSNMNIEQTVDAVMELINEKIGV